MRHGLSTGNQTSGQTTPEPKQVNRKAGVQKPSVMRIAILPSTLSYSQLSTKCAGSAPDTAIWHIGSAPYHRIIIPNQRGKRRIGAVC